MSSPRETSRAARRQAILDCLTTASIGSQAELQSALARRNIRVSQATLSRDLASLGVVPLKGAGGTLAYQLGAPHKGGWLEGLAWTNTVYVVPAADPEGLALRVATGPLKGIVDWWATSRALWIAVSVGGGRALVHFLGRLFKRESALFISESRKSDTLLKTSHSEIPHSDRGAR